MPTFEETSVPVDSIRHRGHWLDIDIGCERLIVSAPDGWDGPNRIVIRDDAYAFHAGERLEVPCHLEDGGWLPTPQGSDNHNGGAEGG